MRRAFTNEEAAHAAASARKTVEMQPGGRGAPVGWAVCDAAGGGFFARLGFLKGLPIEVWPQRDPATMYVGHRHERGCVVEVNDPDLDAIETLEPRLDLRNHSPTGFEWGYGGSGPAQLALAILCDALNDDERALRHYQDFKRRVIAIIGGPDFAMPAGKIRELIDRYEAGSTEATRL